MSQMPYPKVVAVLEGTMERAFVNKNMHYVHVMPISNGHTWTVPAMIKQIETLFGTIDYEADLFVVWFDREKRTEEANDIAAAVRDALILSGIPDDKLNVIVTDRNTENLFLLDGELLNREGLAEAGMPHSLGQNGKVIVRGLFREKGKKYVETHDGVRMLKGLDLSTCSEFAPEVGELKQSMPDCWWG